MDQVGVELKVIIRKKKANILSQKKKITPPPSAFLLLMSVGFFSPIYRHSLSEGKIWFKRKNIIFEKRLKTNFYSYTDVNLLGTYLARAQCKLYCLFTISITLIFKGLNDFCRPRWRNGVLLLILFPS